jgi:hypothetical protein
MKIVKILSVALLLSGFHSPAQQFSFTKQPNDLIPEGNPTEYSSTIDVTGVAGWLTNVTVSLTVTGGYTGDYYSYLSCDNGGFAVLLNRVGKMSTNAVSYEDIGLSITLDDRAAADVHTYGDLSGAPLTGTWQPDGRTNAPLLVVETDSRPALLSSFNTLNPNGEWTLFITDAEGNGITGTLVEWQLAFEAVPEPAALSLALLGGGILLVRRRRRNHSRRR